jgi:hypothetical protein
MTGGERGRALATTDPAGNVPASPSCTGRVADGKTVLPIRIIRCDPSTQARYALDYSTIEDYADDMAAGIVFPPITVYFDGAARQRIDELIVGIESICEAEGEGGAR